MMTNHTSPSTTTVIRAEDIGLLVLRLVAGFALASHGAQKLFGWFNGAGIEGTSGFFEKLGYDPGKLFAVIAGLSELGGGLLLAGGLLTPLAAAAVIGVMLNAVSASWDAGFYGGFELPMLYAVVGVTVAFTGPGRFALDHGRSWERHGPPWAVLSLVLGAGAAALTLIYKAL